MQSVDPKLLNLGSSQYMTFGGTGTTATVTIPISCYKDDMKTKLVLTPGI